MRSVLSGHVEWEGRAVSRVAEETSWSSREPDSSECFHVHDGGCVWHQRRGTIGMSTNQPTSLALRPGISFIHTTGTRRQ